MSYTLKGKTSDHIVSMFIDITDTKQVYQDARNYLKSQDHKRDEIEIKLEKDLYDYERKPLEEKLDSLDDCVVLYNIHDEALQEYHFGSDGQVLKTKLGTYD